MPMPRAEDITYLIYFILYQYYFATLKLYALFTLHITSWGTREGVGGGGLKSKEADAPQAMDEKARLAHPSLPPRRSADFFWRFNLSRRTP